MNYELSIDHKVIDIDNYIPFRTVQDILNFCSPNDGLLEMKKAAFRKRIYACGGRMPDVASFAPVVVDAFFEGSPLLGTLKWPYKRYIFFHYLFTLCQKTYRQLFLSGDTISLGQNNSSLTSFITYLKHLFLHWPDRKKSHTNSAEMRFSRKYAKNSIMRSATTRQKRF